jgi:hypothetical protein
VSGFGGKAADRCGHAAEPTMPTMLMVGSSDLHLIDENEVPEPKKTNEV